MRLLRYDPCFRIGWYSLFCLASLTLVAGVRAEPVVERVSFTPRSDGMGYVVRFHTTEPVLAYRAPVLVEGNQLEVILFNTSLAAAYQHDAPLGPVEQYEARPWKEHLIFRFTVSSPAALEAAAYRDRGSPDLLMGLTYRGDAPAALPAPVAASAAAAPPTASEASRAQGASAHVPARERWKLDTVVIDAGHGGKDAGAVAHGVREKDVTLAVALRLGRYIEEKLGLRVVYTRDDDRFIELRERGRLANQAGAKLFISIHANAAANQSATGTETYLLGLHKSEAARKVMERENSVVAYESDPNQYEGYDESSLILHTLAQSAYMRKSEQLAGLVEEQFRERIGRKSRGVKQAGFYVLWSASMPAILVELGFVTNPGEAAFLKSEQGQDYLASAIFRAVRDFKEQYDKDLDLVEVK